MTMLMRREHGHHFYNHHYNNYFSKRIPSMIYYSKLG